MIKIQITFILNCLGNAIFVGIIVLIITMALQYKLSKYRNKWFDDEMKVKDIRMKLINELLTGMKIVKLYAWEEAFLARISAERQKEISILRKSYLNGMLNWFVFLIYH